jgi:hypothetical protein
MIVQNKRSKFIEMTAHLVLSFCSTKSFPISFVEWIKSSFSEFGNVLQGSYLTNWKQVCHEHLPEPVNSMMVSPECDRSVPENFQHAIA